jgi:hypothetical protein
MKSDKMSTNSEPMEANKPIEQTSKLWVCDTNISKLSGLIREQLINDKARATETEGTDNSNDVKYKSDNDSTVQYLDTPQQIRFNLIWDQNSANNNHKLQQFKSFATALCQADNDMAFLPYTTDKQHLSPISTFKQINNMDDNKLTIYFKSYFNVQQYSLSGFFHIKSQLNPSDLFNKKEVIEWLAYNKYFVKLSVSQNEGMVKIGALCFSSQFMFRDDLKQAIINHPSWNSDKMENPPIFDIFPASFSGF